MKWLQDNPLGMALAAISGVFVLLALAMAIIWTLPVSVESTGTETGDAVSGDSASVPVEIGALGTYQVINEKPVFNVSRSPEIVAVDNEVPEDDGAIEVTGAPEVRLTGVVITPGKKIASLTPANGELESVMAQEGQSLTGEFVGWQVSSINPRKVVLESRDGQKLELELQVHDTVIKEPPKPAAPAKPAQTSLAGGGQLDNEEDEPMSRAEQIRQRIAERREELRLEQEAQQAPGGAQADGASKSPKTSSYQNAIRNLMNNKPKDQGNNDKEDG